MCDKDQKTWVDISNLSAKAPVVDNRILLKVLVVDKPQHTKIFSSLYKSTQEATNTKQYNEEQSSRPSHPSQNSQSSAHKMTKSTSDTRPIPHSHQRSNLTPPPRAGQTQEQPQVPKPTVKSPPARINSTHDDFDLLGDKPTTSHSNPPPSNIKSPPPTSTQTFDDFNLLGGDHTEVTKPNKPTHTFSSPKQDQPDKTALYNMTRDELKNLRQQEMDAAIQDKLAFANKQWADEEKNKSDKEKAYGEVEDSIKRWAGKDNQRNNIRALLCTVHEVIWTGADWQPLSLSDLMMPAQIKKHYFKAITKVHPDKNQHADYKQRYIAERITNELNAAWDEFRKTNP